MLMLIENLNINLLGILHIYVVSRILPCDKEIMRYIHDREIIVRKAEERKRR